MCWNHPRQEGRRERASDAAGLRPDAAADRRLPPEHQRALLRRPIRGAARLRGGERRAGHARRGAVAGQSMREGVDHVCEEDM